ncbi:MAG: hypothetical protein RL653_4308 [Pseudomonadota bacterium]
MGTLSFCAMLPLALAASLVTAAAATGPLDSWHADQVSTQRVGMYVLGTWALGNILVGGVGTATATDERTRSFHLGNLAWNGVNLVLAGAGLWSALRAPATAPDARALLIDSEFQEKLFFVNAALDVAYLATSAFLWQRGEARGDVRLVGFGQALLLQGAFLLAFDTVMGILHVRLTHRLLEQVQISPLGVLARF